MNRELVLSLSKEKGDFIVQPFKGSGKGGQKRNKTMSCCRITHPASGAVAEGTNERSFFQNRSEAFKRLCNSEKFQQWLKIACAEKMGVIADAEEEVNKAMEKTEDFKVEVKIDGKWVAVSMDYFDKEEGKA